MPFTVPCLSPLPGFKYHARELPVILGSEVVFPGYSGFLHHSQPASHYLSQDVAEKAIIIKIPNFTWKPRPESVICVKLAGLFGLVLNQHMENQDAVPWGHLANYEDSK